MEIKNISHHEAIVLLKTWKISLNPQISPVFLEAYQSVFKTPFQWISVSENHKTILIFLTGTTSSFKKNPFISYQPLVFNPELEKQNGELKAICSKAISYLKAQIPAIFNVEFSFHQASDLRPFINNGFELRQRYTFYIHNQYQPENQVTKKLAKAFINSLEFKPCNFNDTGFELLKQTAKQNGFYTEVEYKLFGELLLKLESKASLLCFKVLSGNSCKGFQVVLIFENTALFWAIGTDIESQHLGSTVLLMDATIKALIANTYSSVDLYGANIPRISEFKSGFGGKLVPYLLLKNSNSTSIFKRIKKALR